MEQKLKVVVYLMLLRKNSEGRTEILLQKRRNTSIFDQKYFFSAGGHVKCGETLEKALLREVNEEIGVKLAVKNLKMRAALIIEELESLVILYSTDGYAGTPQNREPERASELIWADLEELPEESEETMLTMLGMARLGLPFG